MYRSKMLKRVSVLVSNKHMATDSLYLNRICLAFHSENFTYNAPEMRLPHAYPKP